jgi:selenocysteine-specific elongation factor
MDLIVGTAGHIDHGKTELIKALTGTDTDRLPEEKSRGITIDLGFAQMQNDDLRIAFIDVPGHEKFVRNMLAGAGGIDAVLIAVAADEGIMPQTREHIDICRLLEIDRGIVAITKCDTVNDRELIDITRSDIAELLADTPLAGAPIIETSSRTFDGISDLRQALFDIARNFQRDIRPLAARLPIDRSFSVKGFGTVVTGTLVSGEICGESELELLPSCRRVRVRGIETFGHKAEKATAGQRTAVNLAGIDYQEIKRGMMLAESGIFSPTQAADAQIRILPTASRPLRDRQRLRIHTGTAELMARVRVLDESGEIAPGASGFVRLSLESPTALILGQRFIARTYSPQTTIGGGEIVLPKASRIRRRNYAGHCSYLARLLELKFDTVLLPETIIRQAGTDGISIGRLLEITGWKRASLLDSLKRAGSVGKIVLNGEMCFIDEAVSAAESAIFQIVSNFHKSNPLSSGITVRELARGAAACGVSEKLTDLAVRRLSSAGKIELRADFVSLAGRTAQLNRSETAIADAIRSALLSAGLQPPKIADLLSSVDGEGAAKRGVFKFLADNGEIVLINDDYALERTVFDTLVNEIRRYAETSADRLIDVAAFKQITGLSRKFAIPILEYLDRKGFTQRAGDKRIVR